MRADVIDQRALAHAVVARFVMLQAEMRHVIAQRQQEMIVAKMPRTEQRPLLSH